MSSSPHPNVHDAERRYLALFNSIDQGFCTIDVAFDADDRPTDYRFVEVSPSFARQTGIEDGAGRWMREIAPDQDDSWFEIYGRVSLTGEPERFEEQSSPLARWWSVYAFRIEDRPRGRIGVLFNEITERKRAEAALRESGERQAFLLRLGDTLRPLADPREIQRRAAQLLGEHLRANQVHYGETVGDIVVIEQGYGEGLPPMIGRFRHQEFGRRLIATCRAGQTALCRDVTTDPTITEADARVIMGAGFRAYVAVPLLKHGAWVATLTVHSIEPRSWSSGDVALVEEVAERTWAGVERARAEEALRTSEEKYRTLFDSIDEGVCLLERLDGAPVDFRYLEANPAFALQIGVGGVVGKTIRELFPNAPEAGYELYEHVWQTGAPVRAELDVANIGRFIELYAFRIGDGGGRRLVVVFRDITERKRREANLAFLAGISRDLEHLTHVAETMDALGARIGRHFNLPRCAFIRIDEAAGEAVCEYDWHRGSMPSLVGVYRITEFFTDEFLRCLRRGEAFEARDVCADSRVDAKKLAALNIASFIAIPLVREGRLQFALCIYDSKARDWRDDEIELMRELTTRIWNRLERARAETALRESEERLRVLIESVKDYAIMTLDPEGRITSWNEGARRLMGYSADEILGRPVSCFYLPEDVRARKPDAEMRQALTEGRSEDESWRIRKDGSRFWVNEIMTPLRGPAGQHPGFARISRDLTERKTFEDALRRAHDELERRVQDRTADLAQANTSLQGEVSERRAAEAEIKALFERLVSIQEEERRRIARDIHDQLGQHMTALRMNLDAARIWADGDPARLEQAHRIQQLAEELDRSIDFLTWELRPAALDHFGLPAALQNLVSGWSARFGIAAEFDTAGTDGLRLSRDAEANLYRLAQEALHNVVKHAGATHVTVVLEHRDQRVVLVVEDDGRGFSLADAQERSDGRLGLVSMRERAVLVGGVLDIETSPGGGTTIFVRIPMTGVTAGAGDVE